MRVHIDVDTRTFVRFGLVLLAFAVGALIVVKTQSALIILGLAAFLALALNPPVTALARRLPGHSRVGGTAIAFVLVVAFLAGLLFLIIPPVIEQSSKFASTVPQLIDQASKQQPVFDDFINRYGLDEQVNTAIDNAKNQATSVAADIGSSLVSGVGALLNGAVTLLFILVLAFLMLVEGPGWLQKTWGLYQDQDQLDRHRNVMHKMYRVVTGYVNGQMLVAGTAAVMGALTIFVLSLIFEFPANLAIPLGALIFLGGLIPMVGATISAILVSLVLVLNSLPAAIAFVIYFIIYQQIENNFISPAIQSRAVELTALAVLSAILVGITLFGLLGAIISIPIAGCIRVLAIDYLEHSRKVREQKNKNPLAKLISKSKTA